MRHPRTPLALLLPLATLVGACATTTPPGDPTRDVDRRVRAYQQAQIDDEITGSNLVIVGDGDGIISRSVVDSGRPGDRDITEETIFPIWSMSKPITIAAMMTLHEQGLFDWDDPVSDYIPCFAELTVEDGDGVRPAVEPLRIEHLMTHRSGWTYYHGWEDGLPNPASIENPIPPGFDRPHPNQTRFDDLQTFCEMIADEPLAFEPGTDFLYGVNQAILGRLVEVLSGMPFEAYLDKAIFTPLEMDDTSFSLDESRRARLQPLWINADHLKGYTHLLDEMTYSPRSGAHFGGEGLVSTADDYANFCLMLLNDGAFKGRRVLSSKSIERMTTPISRDIMAEFGTPPGMDMGYSVFVLRDARREGTAAPPGIFGWSGYHNTHFWIDPTNEMFVLWMSRAREFSFEIPRGLRETIYGSAD